MVLITGTVTMLSGFCFLEILFSAPRTANAASDSMSEGSDACAEGQAVETEASQVTPIKTADQQGALLPCCVDGSHTVVTSLVSHDLELSRLFLAALIANVSLLPVNIPQRLDYQVPIDSPPELAALKTVNLRL